MIDDRNGIGIGIWVLCVRIVSFPFARSPIHLISPFLHIVAPLRFSSGGISMERSLCCRSSDTFRFCYSNVRSGCCFFFYLPSLVSPTLAVFRLLLLWLFVCTLLFKYVLGLVREWQLSLHICAVCFFCFSLPYKTDCRRTKDKITKQNQNQMKESRKRWWYDVVRVRLTERHQQCIALHK